MFLNNFGKYLYQFIFTLTMDKMPISPALPALDFMDCFKFCNWLGKADIWFTSLLFPWPRWDSASFQICWPLVVPLLWVAYLYLLPIFILGCFKHLSNSKLLWLQAWWNFSPVIYQFWLRYIFPCRHLSFILVEYIHFFLTLSRFPILFVKKSLPVLLNL